MIKSKLIVLMNKYVTVLSVKSVSDVMFYVQSYEGLIIDRSRMYNPRINTQVIYRFVLAQVEFLLHNCKQNIAHCHFWLARQ